MYTKNVGTIRAIHPILLTRDAGVAAMVCNTIITELGKVPKSDVLICWERLAGELGCKPLTDSRLREPLSSRHGITVQAAAEWLRKREA